MTEHTMRTSTKTALKLTGNKNYKPSRSQRVTSVSLMHGKQEKSSFGGK